MDAAVPRCWRAPKSRSVARRCGRPCESAARDGEGSGGPRRAGRRIRGGDPGRCRAQGPNQDVSSPRWCRARCLKAAHTPPGQQQQRELLTQRVGAPSSARPARRGFRSAPRHHITHAAHSRRKERPPETKPSLVVQALFTGGGGGRSTPATTVTHRPDRAVGTGEAARGVPLPPRFRRSGRST